MTNYERHKRDLEGIAGKTGRCFCVDVAAAAGVECKAEGENCGACMLRVMAWAAAECAEPEAPWVAYLPNITYIEHSGHYSFIHYWTGLVERVRVRHSRMEEILEPHKNFCTIEKGVIVNMDHIDPGYVRSRQSGWQIGMKDGARLQVARRREAEFERAYTEYKRRNK